MLGYRNFEIIILNFMLLNDYEATNIGDFAKVNQMNLKSRILELQTRFLLLLNTIGSYQNNIVSNEK
jgi:hypothetical protein